MISGRTRVFALLGNPVAHSLSPAMHNAWIADHGFDAVYVALQVSPPAFEAFKSTGLAGCNVTVPFKEWAARAADEHSPEAARLGAANVLAWRTEILVAHNTDMMGFVDSLDEASPGWRARVKTALIVGAGGAARAIGAGLQAAGAQRLVVTNRTAAKAEETAALIGAETRPFERIADAFAEADLIVNATSLGLGGGGPDWPMEAAKPSAIIADAVYAPLETGLLKAARARGLETVDGLGMLIHQGARAFEIWFGVKPDTAKARERLIKLVA